ncbi:S8 family serine peptidase [Rhodanobacter sp. MP7CTX1]|uniref:S8 family serine peptidase n=1 Tax=Rhodanobacter sp. MP7CTX1 TaxID=2723084 RepID=UPI001619BDA2|nr:S8 family serine peptidase [Rhodanobacter sp. MP7CTX1]MBB6188883.1 serine protease [Rhodanobacter sp. MP7CTX1]
MNRLTMLHLAALTAAIGIPSAHAANFSISPNVIGVINARTMQDSGQYDRFIVTYRNGSTERANSQVAAQTMLVAASRAKLYATANTTSGVALGVTWRRKLAVGADLLSTSRKLSKTEATTLMQQIATDPSVAHVEADVMMHAVKDFAQAAIKPAAASPGGSTPNDPLNVTNHLQWHMQPGNGAMTTVGRDTTAYPNWGGNNASTAWASYDGTGVTVAVIDTGVTHHGDLNEGLTGAGYDVITDALTSGRAVDGRVPGGWDTGDWTTGAAYSSCNGGSPEASSWHGTHVFGNIAAVNSNGVGVDGIATNAAVVPIRALGHCGGATSDIADAIEWASGGTVPGIPTNPNPAQVISMSLGGAGSCSSDDVTSTAINDAISRGVTVVVAAGNDGQDVANASPASCPGVIAVASVGITGKRAFYSNYGNGVTIASPGGGIYPNDASSGTTTPDSGFVWSTVNDGATTEDQTANGPTYGGMAGTSQATPHVTGVVALMIEAVKEAGHATLTPAQISQALTNSARSFPAAPDHTIGAGIVDANAAIQAAINIDNIAPSIPLTSGVAATAAGSAGGSNLYSVSVPAGATNLTMRTLGGTGDVSLYVKRGNPPGSSGAGADFSSVKPNTNNETVVETAPAGGVYYMLVTGGTKNFAGVQVLANFVTH